jgi:hypothetical protein
VADDLPATLLAVAGLDIPADEMAELSDLYPTIRAGVDLLYDPAFADADPYLVPTVNLEKIT